MAEGKDNLIPIERGRDIRIEKIEKIISLVEDSLLIDEQMLAEFRTTLTDVERYIAEEESLGAEERNTALIADLKNKRDVYGDIIKTTERSIQKTKEFLDYLSDELSRYQNPKQDS